MNKSNLDSGLCDIAKTLLGVEISVKSSVAELGSAEIGCEYLYMGE